MEEDRFGKQSHSCPLVDEEGGLPNQGLKTIPFSWRGIVFQNDPPPVPMEGDRFGKRSLSYLEGEEEAYIAKD